MKCIRSDETSQSITLHYVSDGNIFLRLMIKKQEFLIPLGVVLRALGA
jgi:DNA-directed RNA polymerase I subunit RPA2